MLDVQVASGQWWVQQDLMYNKVSGYSGFYWSKELYYEQFHKAGFEMKQEILLDEVTSRRVDFIHIGNIWQKPED